MAIVRDYIAPNGVHVRVHDDCYVGISEEELARRRRAVSEAILAIDRAVQLREMETQTAGGPGGANKEENETC